MLWPALHTFFAPALILYTSASFYLHVGIQAYLQNISSDMLVSQIKYVFMVGNDLRIFEDQRMQQNELLTLKGITIISMRGKCFNILVAGD